MKFRIAGPSLLCLLMAFLAHAAASDYQLTFQTSDCNGDSGMATIPISAIYKIESFQCDGGKGERKQVLVRTRRDRVTRATGVYGGSVTVEEGYDSYDAMLVTVEEAGKIQEEIEHYMNARRKNLEQGGTIILEQ